MRIAIVEARAVHVMRCCVFVFDMLIFLSLLCDLFVSACPILGGLIYI